MGVEEVVSVHALAPQLRIEVEASGREAAGAKNFVQRE
jgi:hypothetical protein